MVTFIIGLLLLVGGGVAYGALCNRIFRPDDRQTPAVRLRDDVDFVPMKKWKNSLIQLLNIAGTGPILGPIQGILFGPIAFITIPIDKIIGKVYPVFGAVLVLSAIGVFIGLLIKGYPLDELWNIGVRGVHPQGLHFIPVFFVTVACGIVSGFHSTQSTLIARTMEHEKEGRI